MFLFQYGCFRKWWVYPPNHPWINKGFPLFSPSILGYPYFWKHPYITLPETNSSHLKMDGWKMIRFLLGWSIFRCFYSLEQVSFGGVADYCIFVSPVMGPDFLEGPIDGQSKGRGDPMQGPTGGHSEIFFFHLENWGS